MELWLWVIISILTIIVLALSVRIFLIKKAAREIRTSFAEKLITDTNTPITLSSRDKDMCALGNDINLSLSRLRSEQHRYEYGNSELQRAITNISHDLRTPLTAIYGYLELLEKEPLNPAAMQYIRILHERTEALTSLTEELFQYSVVVSGEQELSLTLTSVNSVLEESIAAFYTTLQEKGITPTISLPETPVFRNLDHTALSRVFANLLSNAIKYSAGDLEISLSESGEILFANSSKDLNSVQVEKLFDRFYTVETVQNSTGLGLSIARTLIEKMHGTISASYEKGRLMIYINLPDTVS
jgi:signal transduction histidine kinase